MSSFCIGVHPYRTNEVGLHLPPFSLYVYLPPPPLNSPFSPDLLTYPRPSRGRGWSSDYYRFLEHIKMKLCEPKYSFCKIRCQVSITAPIFIPQLPLLVARHTPFGWTPCQNPCADINSERTKGKISETLGHSVGTRGYENGYHMEGERPLPPWRSRVFVFGKRLKF